MSNEITAYFKGRAGVSESLYQYDYGMVLNLDGIELPSSFECYFDTTGSDEAIPAIGTDGRVAIPNDCLSRPGDVTLHIPLHSGANDSQVEYVVKFRVIGRARPVDGGTPEQQTAIEQALALLQNPITNIEQIVNEALAFTGDTFDEMQEQLDADQAAYESSMNSRATEFESGINARQSEVESDFSTLNSQFDNLAINLTPNSKEVLYSGTVVLDGTITLSKNISNFDFIDIEYQQTGRGVGSDASITKRIPAVAGTYWVQDFAMDYSSTQLQFFEQKLTLSGTSLVAESNYNIDATADTWVKNRGAYLFEIKRVLGIKMGSASPAELTDLRVGANGLTYPSAGESVRDQITNLNVLNGGTTTITAGIKGGYYDATGSLVTNAAFYYLSVSALNIKSISVTLTRSLSLPLYLVLDQSGTVIDSHSGLSAGSYTFEVPENASRILLNYYDNTYHTGFRCVSSGVMPDSTLSIVGRPADAKAVRDQFDLIEERTRNLVTDYGNYRVGLKTSTTMCLVNNTGTTVMFPCESGKTYYASTGSSTEFNKKNFAFFDHIPEYLEETSDYGDAVTSVTCHTNGYGFFYAYDFYDEDLAKQIQIEVGEATAFVPPVTATDWKARDAAEVAAADCAVLWDGDIKDIYEKATVLNGTKSYTDGKLVWTIPSSGSVALNGIMFSESATPITLTDDLKKHLIVEMDYETTCSYADLVIQEGGVVKGAKRLSVDGTHISVAADVDSIRYIYIRDINSNDLGKTVSISNITVYQAEYEIENRYNENRIFNLEQRMSDLENRGGAVDYGNKLLTIGDSLTNAVGGGVSGGKRWQNVLLNKLGFNSFTTSGAIGLTVANLVGSNSIYSHVMALTTDADVDFITFWGGTNDWAMSIPLGDFETQKSSNTRDNTTFYGGLFDCIEKLLTLYPTTPIIMIGTPMRVLNDEQGTNSNNTKNNGRYLIEFVDAVKEVAEYFSIPFLDLYRASGINDYNIRTYMFRQTPSGADYPVYYLHFSDDGEDLVGERITAFIKSIK